MACEKRRKPHQGASVAFSRPAPPPPTPCAGAGLLASRSRGVTDGPGALFADGGQVKTPAGLSAGIDLSLHVIRTDFGAEVGARVARHMVAPPHRDGGQAQFFDAGRRAL